MAETQTKKKRRKTLTTLEQVQEEVAVQNAIEVTEALEELKAQGKRADIQVCPKCKSPKVKKAQSTGGDMGGHLGMCSQATSAPTVAGKNV